MMTRKTNIRHWHSTHNDWLRALHFYKEEIAILNKRLIEVAGKNTGQAVSVLVEHFQNQFVLHQNNIDELSHAISLNLEVIGNEITAQTGFVNEELLSELEQQREVFVEEESAINGLRHAFNLFCADWM